MAKQKDIYEKEIIKVINENNLMTIYDIFAFYTGIKKSQFYNLDLEKSDDIIKAIDDNKIKTKHSLKNKWFKSDNAALQIGLMKLIGTEEEVQRLNGSKQQIEQTIKVTKPIIIKIDGDEIDL